MSDAVISAMITGMIALIGTIITNLTQSNKTRGEMRVVQAETRKDIQYLTEEVRRHNNFAQRMPAVEEQIKAVNRRLDDLERRE